MNVIDQIDALAGKATPGPWKPGSDPCHFDAPEIDMGKWRVYIPTDADAELISILRNNVAAISKALRAAEKVNSAMVEAHDGSRGWIVPEGEADALCVALNELNKGKP